MLGMYYKNRIMLFISLHALIYPCKSKRVVGEIKTHEKWVFLERFCFLSEDGTFNFDIVYDLDYAVQNLLLYYDEETQWPAVYKSQKSCHEREAVMLEGNNQIINLTQRAPGLDCEVIRNPGEKAFYHCTGARTFRSARERWWFIAVSNCESTKGLSLYYTLTMTNGYSYWYKHFSADEFYILRTNMVALAMQVGLLFLSLLAAYELRNRHLLHTTYRLYMTALVIQILGIIFLIAHYSKYGFDGAGVPGCKLLGRILTSLSTIVMVLFLLLIAKGYTITRGRLRQLSTIKLTAFMCFFCVTYGILFVYEQNVFDPGEVLYLYESPAGYGLLALRCLGWIMFLYSCYFTVKHYPEKVSFYNPFFAFYTFWFLSGPVIIVISNHVIDKWVREKVVNGVEMAASILGHAFFLCLARPSATNKNFPYHVRTSQITAMEESMEGKIPGGHLDAFNAHAYAPEPPEPKNYTNSDLFIVSGAFEMKPMRGSMSNRSFSHHSPCEPSMFQNHEVPSAPPEDRIKP